MAGYGMDAGSVQWSRDTRTVHTFNLSVTDDMLASVSDTDTVEIVLHYRNGRAATVRVPQRAVWRLVRATDKDSY